MKFLDCKQIIHYYKMKMPNTIKDIKETGIHLLVNRMCKCYCDQKYQHLVFRKFYNSRNNKNINQTRRIKIY